MYSLESKDLNRQNDILALKGYAILYRQFVITRIAV